MEIPSNIKVALIEDNITYRKSVTRSINKSGGFSCVYECASIEEALPQIKSSQPHIVLLDIGLPGMSGIEAIPLIYEQASEAKIIILTVFDDQDKIFRAICAGASGYLLKTAPIEEITAAITEVLSGGAPMNPRIARRVLDLFARIPQPKNDYGLTTRESEILELMVKGLIKKEIAAELSLSFHTVDSHLRNIYQKLQVNTRTGAVAKALKEKLF